MLNGLDLFSGIGGITLALGSWVRTVTYCENDRYAQSVLLSRMRDGQLPRAPIWDDVQTLSGRSIPRVDIITAGFPCQDISLAGDGAGLDGERSGLFFEVRRLVSECRPQFVFLENVPAITLRGLDRILLEFTALGYDTRWTVVSAASVGAPHRRDRWWMLAADTDSIDSRNERQGEMQGNGAMDQRQAISGNDGQAQSLAHSKGSGWSQGRPKSEGQQGRSKSSASGLSMADTNGKIESIAGSSGEEIQGPEEIKRLGRCSGLPGRESWSAEPTVGRVVNGLPHRVDRIRGLGNSVVPQAAREAFVRLTGLKAREQ